MPFDDFGDFPQIVPQENKQSSTAADDFGDFKPEDLHKFTGQESNNFVRKFVKSLPTVGGATIGELMGGPLGAGAGAVAGRAVQGLIEDPGHQDTPGEALKQMGIAGAEGLALALAGRGISNVAGRYVGPYLKGAAQSVSDSAPEFSLSNLAHPKLTVAKYASSLSPSAIHAGGKLGVEMANELPLNLGPFAKAGASKIASHTPTGFGGRPGIPQEELPISNENVYYPNRAPAGEQGPIVEDPGLSVGKFQPRGTSTQPIIPSQEIQFPESMPKLDTSKIKVGKFPLKEALDDYSSPGPYKSDLAREKPYIKHPK